MHPNCSSSLRPLLMPFVQSRRGAYVIQWFAWNKLKLFSNWTSPWIQATPIRHDEGSAAWLVGTATVPTKKAKPSSFFKQYVILYIYHICSIRAMNKTNISCSIYWPYWYWNTVLRYCLWNMCTCMSLNLNSSRSCVLTYWKTRLYQPSRFTFSICNQLRLA
jgi:hypothetical protein